MPALSNPCRPLRTPQSPPSLEPELCRIARQRLRRSGPLTLLGATGLVHEGRLKLSRQSGWQALEPSHFMAGSRRRARSYLPTRPRWAW
ncbi:hypothetical protein [Roseateles sp.]|uniref:hypothetical protein n=1 Tax=Roseateles sp. TaxID=1971397 RepID=UPI0025D206F6|nr:hypothetical protein [Roseateles sp.]MBV8033796.1 hypothetical protein [Roseateles sp.]